MDKITITPRTSLSKTLNFYSRRDRQVAAAIMAARTRTKRGGGPSYASLFAQ